VRTPPALRVKAVSAHALSFAAADLAAAVRVHFSNRQKAPTGISQPLV
jgi:hypothetical protein